VICISHGGAARFALCFALSAGDSLKRRSPTFALATLVAGQLVGSRLEYLPVRVPWK
jgi:hypothetical protein